MMIIFTLCSSYLELVVENYRLCEVSIIKRYYRQQVDKRALLTSNIVNKEFSYAKINFYNIKYNYDTSFYITGIYTNILI